MIISFVEVALGIAAIALAMFHARDLRKMTLTISTRYLDVFPAYLSDLATLLSKAKREITICCDFPAYGRFSNRKAFVDYKITLERQRVAGVKIGLTCVSQEQRRVDIERQFTERFEHKSRSFLADLEVFLSDYSAEGNDAKNLTLAQFKKLAEEANAGMLRDVFRRSEVVEISQPIHIFFWLIDGKEAIFSIASHSEKGLEQGFYTRDKRLITALEEMCRRYRQEQKAVAETVPNQAPTEVG